ncbi:MAG: hypothetical protein ACO1QR_13210 [Chthoniobacteraceae bacterium]
MRKFDVMIDGLCRANLTEECVEELYRTGDVVRSTKCRTAGASRWQTVDECIPILKYVYQSLPPVRRSPEAAAAMEPPRSESSRSIPLISERTFNTDDRRKAPLTSALKAGWICFGLGAAFAWFFPPGYVFYSVAAIMSIVAMATHQTSRGLVLMLSTFVAIGTSAFLSFILAVGMFAAAIQPVAEQMERDRKRWEAQERELEEQMRRATEQMSRTMDKATANLDSILTNPPRIGRPESALPASDSQDELLQEIARLETKERELRRNGRSLELVMAEYLRKLRSTYDDNSERSRR